MYPKIFSLTVSFLTVLGLFAGLSLAQMHDDSQMKSMKDMNMSKTAKPTVFITPATFKIQLDQVYKSYLSIQASLSSDELQNAQTGALALTKSLPEVDMKLLTDMKAHMAWMTSSEKLAKDAEHIAAAPDIETARTEFKQASDDLIAIAKQFGTSGKTVLYVFHCSMAFKNKGADWVQNEKTAKNPYLGKSMLTCGKITDTIGIKSGK
jgi:membrane fusion protein, copper/silver efflux system